MKLNHNLWCSYEIANYLLVVFISSLFNNQEIDNDKRVKPRIHLVTLWAHAGKALVRSTFEQEYYIRTDLHYKAIQPIL